MMPVATRKNWIQLRLGDPQLAGVTVHAEDGDLFSLSKRMVARAGMISAQIEALDVQVAALRRELEGWTSTHADAIRDAFVVLKGDYFLFLVVMKGKAYDAALEDALTDLDIRIAQDPEFTLVKLSVQALPAFDEAALRSFLPSGLELKGGA